MFNQNFPPEPKIDSQKDDTPSTSCCSFWCLKKKKNNQKVENKEEKNVDKKVNSQVTKFNMTTILEETGRLFSSHTVIEKSSHKIKNFQIIKQENFFAIITANDDHSISLWDEKGNKIKTLRGHHDEIKSLAVKGLEELCNEEKANHQKTNSDYKLVFFSAGKDHTIKKWDIFLQKNKNQDMQEYNDHQIFVYKEDKVELFGDHSQEINFIQLIKVDGKVGKVTKLISASSDRTIKIWDLKNDEKENDGIKKKDFEYAHEDSVYMLAIHEGGGMHDKTRIFSAGHDGQIKFWDENLMLKKSVNTQNKIYVSMVLNLEGNLLYMCDKKGSIYCLNSEGSELKKLFDTHHKVSLLQIHEMCISNQKEEYFLTGSENGEIRIWNIKNEKEIARIHAHDSKITSLYFHSHEFPSDTKSQPSKQSFDFNNTEYWLYSSSDDKSIKKWNLNSILSPNQDHSKCVNSITFDHDEKKIISSGMDGKIIQSDLESKRIEKNFDHRYPVIFATVLLKDKYIMAIESNGIRIWDLEKKGGEDMYIRNDKGNEKEIFLKEFKKKKNQKKLEDSKNDKKIIKEHEKEDQISDKNSEMTCLFILKDDIAEPKHLEIFIGLGNGEVKMYYFESNIELLQEKNTFKLSNKNIRITSILVNSKKMMYFISEGSEDDNEIKIFNLNLNKNESLLPEQHKESVVAIVLDQKEGIISASKDKIIKIWNSENKFIQNLKILNLPIITMTISKDKKHIASCDQETIFVWTTKDFRILSTIQANSGFLRSLAVSSLNDNKIWVVSGSLDGRVRSWPIDSGELFWSEEPCHTTYIRCVRITPDNKYIITGGRDGTLKIWEIFDKKYIKTVNVSETMIYRIEILPKKNKIIVVTNGKIIIFDLKLVIDKDPLREIPKPKEYSIKTHIPRILTFDKNENYLFSGGQDKIIYMWDLNKVLNSNSEDIEIESPEFNELIHNTFKSKEIDATRIEDLVGKIDGYIISGEASGKIKVWDIKDNKKPRYEKISMEKTPISCLTVNDDGSLIIAGYMNKNIKVWHFDDNKDECKLTIETGNQTQHHVSIKSLVLVSKVNILVCGNSDGEIMVYDFSDLSRMNPLIYGNSEDKRNSKEDDRQKVLEGDNNNKYHSNSIFCMDLSKDQKYLVSAGQDKRTILWEIEDKKLKFSFRKEGEPLHKITCFCLSENDGGNTLVLGGDDRKIRVWKYDFLKKSYVPDCKWIAHKEAIIHVIISNFHNFQENTADEYYIFSGSVDQYINIWNFKGELKGFIHTSLTITSFLTIPGFVQKKNKKIPKNKIIFVGDDPKINVSIGKIIKKQNKTEEEKKEKEKIVITYKRDKEFKNWNAHSKTIKFLALTSIPELPQPSEMKKKNKKEQGDMNSIQTPRTALKEVTNNEISKNPYNISKLITGGDDGTLRVWDIAHRILLRSFNNVCLDFTPIFLTDNGRLCLLNDSIFDLYQGEILAKFTFNLNPKPIQLKYSKNAILALENNGEIRSHNFSVNHYLTNFFKEDTFLNVMVKNNEYLINYCLQKKNSLSPLFFTDLHYLLTSSQTKIGDYISQNPNIKLISFLKEDVLGMNCIDLITNKNQYSEIFQAIFKIMERDTDFYNKMLFYQYALIKEMDNNLYNKDVPCKMKKEKPPVNKTTVPEIYNVLNKLLTLFGEDTTLIKKILEHSLVKVSHELYDESLEMAELTHPIFEIFDNIYHISKKRIEKAVKEKFGDSKSEKKRSLVRVKVILLPYITDTTIPEVRNFYKHIIKFDPTNSIFSNYVLRLVTSYKWKRFLRIAFFIDGLLFTLFFVWFFVNFIYFFPEKLQNRGEMNNYAKISIFADCFSFVYCIIFFIRTIFRVLKKHSIINFFISSYWNIIDFILFFLLIAVGVIDIIITCDASMNIEGFKVLVAVTMILYWNRFMSLLRGLSGSAFMIRLIIRVFHDIIYFLLVLGLFIVGFSFAGYMLQDDFHNSVIYDNLGNAQYVEATRQNSLSLFYRLTLGDFNLVDNFQPTYHEAFWLLIVYSTVVLSIVLLNLLISILNDTYDKVMSSEALMRNYELMHIIYEIEEKIYNLDWVNRIVRLDFQDHSIVKWVSEHLFFKNKKHLGKYLVYIYNDAHEIADDRDINYERIRSIVEREEFQIKNIKLQVDSINKNIIEKNHNMSEKMEKKFDEIQRELKKISSNDEKIKNH